MKAWFIAAGAALSGWLGILAVPMAILVISNIIDYATGIAAAKYRGNEVNSSAGLRGIVKKICMWLLVAVGMLMDSLLAHATVLIVLDVETHFVIASVAALWLIANEFISILENINDIGTPLPPFLMKMALSIKSQAEKQADIKTK